MSDLISQRRGSAASCVSVTISVETSTTYLSTTDSPDPSFPKPAAVEPFAGTRSSPHTSVEHHFVALEDVGPEDCPVLPPPPPYTFPSPSSARGRQAATSIEPLSFYPFSTLDRVPCSPLCPDPSRPATHDATTFEGSPPIRLGRSTLATNPLSTDPCPTPPPPSYRDVPQTSSETCFVWGFVCPVLWIVGTTRLWRSSRPEGCALRGEKSGRDRRPRRRGATSSGRTSLAVGLEACGLARDDESDEASHGIGRSVVGDLESGRAAASRLGRVVVDPNVEESLRLWRDEERLWAERCAWALGGFVAVGLVVAVMVVGLTGNF
ncbi:hypothetical protein JCM10212_002779 [Sporobolomyces blumeae]